jgi:conjugal transfer/entry exclusion protein
MQTSRRSLVLAALLVGPVVTVREKEAKADLFGGDLVILGGILVQAISTVTNLVNMLTAIKYQITMMERLLTHLDISSFNDVVNLIRSSQMAYNTLTRDVHAIEYTVEGVNRAYHKIFPSDVSTTKTADMKPIARGWHQETLGAAMVAQRSQATLSTMENNTTQAEAVLSRSSNTEGEIAQLQAVNQMLGIISSQLNTVISTLDTTGRVTADMAASGASDNVVSFEKKDRNLENYTDRGDSVPVMSKLPDPY